MVSPNHGLPFTEYIYPAGWVLRIKLIEPLDAFQESQSQ
jgi:hypothetical protein